MLSLNFLRLNWVLLPWMLALTLAVSFMGLATHAAASDAPATPLTDSPSFVNDRECHRCHSTQAKQWTGSDHDMAMRPANAESVRGDFNDSRFAHGEMRYRFFKRDERYFVNTQGPDGTARDFEIEYTFGFDPLQQYLIKLDNGRFQVLTVSWDTRPKAQGGQRWFELYPDEQAAPGDPLHWTGRFNNWNQRCSECHSTNLRVNYDPDSHVYDTRWSEVNVGCQACHGPGSEHLEWAKKAGKSAAKAGADDGLMVDYADANIQVDACARCHARRHPVSPDNAHGREFLDDYLLATLRPDLYYPDGQVRDEVYVYGSFVQSKMHRAGVRCTDCHNPHNATLKADGNAVCTRCHQATPPDRFPTLKGKDYDTRQHHNHPSGTAGAQCVNCHMPETTYMVVDGRRDHSFSIPRPDLSVKLGTPNACNRCHQQQTPQWAADRVTKWYGPDRPGHFAEALVKGRSGDGEALITLFRQANTPAIVTATALEILSRLPTNRANANAIIEHLTHDSPMVRRYALTGVETLPPYLQQQLAALALADPVRAVRIEAARVLAMLPDKHLSAADGIAFKRALQEYWDLQQSLAATPEAHLNLGVMHLVGGNSAAALASYQEAIRLAPDFGPARVNLANLYNQLGQNDNAEKELNEAIRQAPDEGELHYSLGLLLSELERLQEAEVALAKAETLLPTRPRVAYNHALTLQNLGRRDEAEKSLKRAAELAPDNADYRYSLAIFYAQGEAWQQALEHAQALMVMVPGNAGVERLVDDLKKRLSLAE